MPKFSKFSWDNLNTCDPRLVKVFSEVIKYVDCRVLVGHRTKEKQDEAYDSGHSQLRWPRSQHNSNPSQAVDVAPYPIDWEDSGHFLLFGGFVLGIAAGMGITLRYGGDWNRDFRVKDNNFDDLVHFEIV